MLLFLPYFLLSRLILMYLRHFVKGKKKYYYIAKAVRKGTSAIQKSVLYIGTADTLYKKLLNLKKN